MKTARAIALWPLALHLALAQNPSPASWPPAERDRYLALENDWGSPRPGASAEHGMVAGTSGPLAIHAGVQALKRGGNAADAALTTSLAQIALSAGGAISYAGILTAVYYDSASGKVHALNAAYNTVRNETSPRTIPAAVPSGRTVLVPGFMAGVEAMHRRFGKRPFASLFDPAIWIAENGVAISPPVGAWLAQQKDVITRLPQTRRIFTKADGELYRTGDLFRQPELARTLHAIARRGAAYMYAGPWARRFIEAVQAEGGRMTREDLARYQPLWSDPLRTTYHGYDVAALPPPSHGGLITLGGLKIAEVAGLRKYPHYTVSPDALYYLIQIVRIENLFVRMSPRMLANYFPGVDPSPEARLSDETAQRIWEYIQKDMAAPAPAAGRGPNHSTGVLAVDARGNVAAILHSSNAAMWGATGIFVDGISIPDSAASQQLQIAQAGPGARLPDATIPLLVSKGGKPVLASTAMGFALHEATLQNLVNILDFGMDPKTSVDQPNFRGPSAADYRAEVVGEGGFSQAVLDGLKARSQPVEVAGKSDQLGYWIGIQIGAPPHRLKGAVTSAMNALVEGY